MATRHARRSADGEFDERLEARREEDAAPPSPSPSPSPADATLKLQQSHGNQAVQRMLARCGRVLARGRDPEFTYDGQSIELETLKPTDLKGLDEAVEGLIDEDLGGVQALFLKNDVMTSLTKWQEIVLGMLEEQYTLDKVEAKHVLASVKRIKAKHRDSQLLHLAKVHVYWDLGEDAPPWDMKEFKRRLVAKGVYLEKTDDDEVLEAIFETGGAFARTKVEFDTANNIELLDEDNIVVLIDHHQQKHQRDKIAHFPPYTGEPGSKFAAGKNLDWHRRNTAAVVKETVQDCVDRGVTSRTGAYAPSKDAIDGIIYDLGITYDDATGKWVGSYHCNPVKDGD